MLSKISLWWNTVRKKSLDIMLLHDIPKEIESHPILQDEDFRKFAASVLRQFPRVSIRVDTLARPALSFTVRPYRIEFHSPDFGVEECNLDMVWHQYVNQFRGEPLDLERISINA